MPEPENQMRDGKQFSLILSALFVLIAGSFLLWSTGQVPWILLAVPILLVWMDWTRKDDLWVGLMPFGVLLLCYQSLGTFSRHLDASSVNVVNVIELERLLFGGRIPAALLQRSLSQTWQRAILDPVTNLLYISHFLTPVVIGLWLWKRRDLYWAFVGGFLFMNYLAFATYMTFPAAPPWWASERAFLSGRDQVLLDRFVLASFVAEKAPNPVAAIPSMHCAFPLYFFLFLRPLLGPRSLWFLLLTTSVVFSVVYLGHHYLVDAWIGFAYGVAGWLCARLLRDSAGRPRDD